MKDFFNLIRWKSILLCIIALIVVRLFLIEDFYKANFDIVISPISFTEYLIFCLPIILIAIASVLINDYFDQDIDKINRAEKDRYIGRTISEKKVLNLFYTLSIVAIIIGYAIGYLNGFLHYGSLLIVFVCVVYFYSLKYKRMFVVGNIVVAFLYAMIIFLPVLFELFALMKTQTDLFKIAYLPIKETLLPITLFLTVITFMLTFIREIIGDMQDEEGDREVGCRSFAIVWGEKKTKKLIYTLGALFIPLCSLFVRLFFEFTQSIISLLLLLIPFAFFCKEFAKAKSIQDYGFLSELLKMIFISGLFVMSMLKFN